MATARKKKIDGPFETTIIKGSHLTVITSPNGSTVLEWDDDQLLKDVREAIASVEGKTNVKTRKTSKSK